MIQVKDVMRHQTFTLSRDMSVFHAAERMREHDVGVIVVALNEAIVGILTDRDIVIRCIAKGKDPRSTKVEEIMSSPVVHCMEDDTMDNIAKKLSDAHVHRLPVLNHSMKFCGLISVRNLCSADNAKGGAVVSKIR